MSIQIKKSSLDSYINTNNEILVGSIVDNISASPEQELPVRKGILAATPEGLKISVDGSGGLVWHEVILTATPGSDNTFTVRFQAQAASLGNSQILPEGSVTTWPVDSICTCYSESGLFDPANPDSDGFFEITIDKDAYAAVADSEYWRFEWDNGYEPEMCSYYGYIKPQIDITSSTFYPDNSEYNYVIIDNALPAERAFIISFYDSLFDRDVTGPISLTLTEIYWVPEGEYAFMEPGGYYTTATSDVYISWSSGLCPCIEVSLPEFLQDGNGYYVAVKCYIKLPLNIDPSDPYEIRLDLPGYHGEPVDGDGIDVDTMRNNGWVVEYV